jgi:hypothetical protein
LALPNDQARVAHLAAENPQNVTIYSQFAKNESGQITSHLRMTVGSPVCEDSLKRLLPGGLVCIDATHGMNDYAYQVFTAMAVDVRTMQPRSLEHFITSNPNAETVSEWLTSLSNRAGGTPAEVIEDKCRTQTPAIQRSWPNTHIHYCFFHTMKTFREEFAGVSKQHKQLLLSWIRKIYYAQNVADLQHNVVSFEQFLSDNRLDKFLDYWKLHWADCLDRWVRCHSVFKIVGTNNFVESFHRTLKHSHVGGQGKRVLALHDCVHILLKLHFFANNKILEQISERGHIASFMKRSRKSLKAKTMEMRQSGRYMTIQDSVLQGAKTCLVAKHAEGEHTEADPGEVEEVYEIRVNEHGSSCNCAAFEQHEVALCKHMMFCAEEFPDLERRMFRPVPMDNSQLILSEMRRWARTEYEKAGEHSVWTDFFKSLDDHVILMKTLESTAVNESIVASVTPTSSDVPMGFVPVSAQGVDELVRHVQALLKGFSRAVDKEIDKAMPEAVAFLQNAMSKLHSLLTDLTVPASLRKPIGSNMYGPIRPMTTTDQRYERVGGRAGRPAVGPMESSMAWRAETLQVSDMTRAWIHIEENGDAAMRKRGAKKRKRNDELVQFSQTASQNVLTDGQLQFDGLDILP